MTNRLTPVGSGLGAEARWGLNVVVQIIYDDGIGDVAACG